MDVVRVCALLDVARDGATRLLTKYRTPNDISPRVVLGTATEFLTACQGAQSVLRKLETGDPSDDDQDAKLLQMISAAVAAHEKANQWLGNR